jgi:hypothetical protein
LNYSRQITKFQNLNPQTMRYFLAIILGTLAFACSNDQSIQLKVEEINNGTVRISVDNPTDMSYQEATFVFRFLGDKGLVLKQDTIPYTASSGDFLPAKSSTFIVQAIPVGTQGVEVSMINQ